jgi:hypothetical protein
MQYSITFDLAFSYTLTRGLWTRLEKYFEKPKDLELRIGE